jgi:hypothetical protein
MNPSNSAWLAPWQPIRDSRPEDPTALELHDELRNGHFLFGIRTRPVAQRQDCPDVLFELLDGSGRFAVVHLAHGQHPETDPRWPETVVYDDWPEFLSAMKVDAVEWAM